MAYEHVRFDLRQNPYRRKKEYYRDLREGRIPEPIYKKPIVTAIQLDPTQAVLATCKADQGVWIGTNPGTGGTRCIANTFMKTKTCTLGARGETRGFLATGADETPGS